MIETMDPAFDETGTLMRSEWDQDELRGQVRKALTTAATEIILAMPPTSGSGTAHDLHLQTAIRALRDAEELGRALRSPAT